ncbi:VOC family protein [Rhizobium sp. ARZ01]|uniref:VOC family protein n=1 Tax=Rhizobium sp. ARZ01 TaxID=2769313 RepID=UPI0032B1AC2B
MSLSVKPFLMFQGRAEEAMAFYASIFPDCAIDETVRCGPGEAGPEGSVMLARFHIGRQSILCIDSPINHDFTFTPPSRCSSSASPKHNCARSMPLSVKAERN